MNVWVVEVEKYMGCVVMFSFYVVWFFGVGVGVLSGWVVIKFGLLIEIYFVVLLLVVGVIFLLLGNIGW